LPNGEGNCGGIANFLVVFFLNFCSFLLRSVMVNKNKSPDIVDLHWEVESAFLLREFL
jgi:hypothetical protein